jgi:hypothetical protein
VKSRIACVTVALVALLNGCSGQPDPSDSTPTFTTEQEAFAAAEQTYRNYVDALNQVDLSDPATFEEVYRWTTGELNAADRMLFSRMHSDGWVVAGDSTVALVAPRSMGGSDPSMVALAVCVNVGAVSLVDASGVSMVGRSRTDLQTTLVSLVADKSSSTHWAIANIVGRDGEPRCE